MNRALSADELAAWRRDGFVVRRGAFAGDEVDRLLADAALAIERCRQANAVDRAQYFVFANADGESASICAGLGHTGTPLEALCRDPGLVDAAAQLFGERQYVHHAKFMNKVAFEGVAWLWHQDYGYWQDMGAIRPDMFSAMVFLDPATRDNGCLQVLPGSHRDGRVAHRVDGDTGGGLAQTFIDGRIMRGLTERHAPTPILAEPGDVLLFDCNLVHASGHNLSPRDRRAAIVAYNADANRPEAHLGWPLVRRGDEDAIRRFRTRADWRLQRVDVTGSG